MRKSLVLAFAVFFPASAYPALSQSNLPWPNLAKAEGRISVNSQLSVSLPVAANDEVDKQQAQALRLFYQVVSASCPLLKETFAELCEVTGVSTNVVIGDPGNRGNRGNQVTINGTIQMMVKPKNQGTSPAQ